MNKIVKRALGYFKILIEHSLRPHEPTLQHILKRMIMPICQREDNSDEGDEKRLLGVPPRKRKNAKPSLTSKKLKKKYPRNVVEREGNVLIRVFILGIN